MSGVKRNGNGVDAGTPEKGSSFPTSLCGVLLASGLCGSCGTLLPGGGHLFLGSKRIATKNKVNEQPLFQVGLQVSRDSLGGEQVPRGDGRLPRSTKLGDDRAESKAGAVSSLHPTLAHPGARVPTPDRWLLLPRLPWVPAPQPHRVS